MKVVKVEVQNMIPPSNSTKSTLSRRAWYWVRDWSKL